MVMHKSIFSLIAVTLVIGLCFAPVRVFAQEGQVEQEKSESEKSDAGVSTTQDQAQTETLEELQTQWAALDQSLKDKEKEYNSAITTEERSRISGEFHTLVAEADVLISKLESAGLKRLQENPNEDQTVRLLMGILINHAAFGKRDPVIDLGQQLLDAGVDQKYFSAALRAPRLGPDPVKILRELMIRAEEAKKDDLPRVKLKTDQGDIVLELFENEAPNTVANFISLVEQGFYNDLNFHRVIEGFMAQGGCPKGDGSGGPGYTIPCEAYTVDYRLHFKNSLSMANAGKDTGGSQFFITFAATPQLDIKHTVFGRVVQGQDVLPKIARTQKRDQSIITGAVPTKITSAEVIRKRDHEYTVKKMGDPEVTTPPTNPPIGSSANEGENVEKSSEKSEGGGENSGEGK